MRHILKLLFIILILSSCSNDTQNKNSNIDDPIEFLSAEIKNEHDNYKLYGQRATIYLEQGKIDPAFRDVNTAIKLNPDDAGLYILLSDIYFVLGNKANSISSLKKANSLEPNSELPLIKLSELFLMTQEYDKAHFFADKAILLNLNVAEPYYYKGMAYLETLDTAKAIINLKIASNIDTSNYAVNMQLGALYYGSNDSISEMYLKQALNEQPENPSALYYLGMLYQDNKDFKNALHIYSKLIKNKKSGKRAYYNSGYIYLVELQDYDKAEEMFKQAIITDGKFVEAVYNLGRTYEAKGDFEQAREYYNKAIEILPNYPLAVQGLNRLD